MLLLILKIYHYGKRVFQIIENYYCSTLLIYNTIIVIIFIIRNMKMCFNHDSIFLTSELKKINEIKLNMHN